MTWGWPIWRNLVSATVVRLPYVSDTLAYGSYELEYIVCAGKEVAMLNHTVSSSLSKWRVEHTIQAAVSLEIKGGIFSCIDFCLGSLYIGAMFIACFWSKFIFFRPKLDHSFNSVQIKS